MGCALGVCCNFLGEMFNIFSQESTIVQRWLISSTPQEDFAARSVTLEEAKQAQFVVDIAEDTWHK